MAGESHAIGRMESPMTIGVSKVYLINKKSKWEGATLAEEVVLVADMHVLNIQLDSTE